MISKNKPGKVPYGSPMTVVFVTVNPELKNDRYNRKGQKGRIAGYHEQHPWYKVIFDDGGIGWYGEDALIWPEVKKKNKKAA